MVEHVELHGHLGSYFSSESSRKAWHLWLEDVNTISSLADDLLEQVSIEMDQSKVLADASFVRRMTSSFTKRVTSPLTKGQLPILTQLLSSGKLNVPREITDLRVQLEGLVDEMNNLLTFDSLTFDKTSRVMTSSSSCGSTSPNSSLVDESIIVGREIQKEEIVRKVLDDLRPMHNISVISIVGMGGLGKTTLAQLVYNDARVKASFHFRIWVSVPLDFDVAKVTRSIIESVTKKTCTLMDLDSLQATVQILLLRKRFLLVLDDLWSEKYSDWEALYAPLRSGLEGSKVIITTRSMGVSSVVGSNPYELPFLQDEDCWDIIKKVALHNNNIAAPHNVDEVGLEVAKKCRGLPMMARVLGSTMSCIHIEEWDAISKSDVWDLIHWKDSIFPTLVLSYYNLPLELKRCYAYCAMFPADHVFDEDSLVYMWMAEGLIQPMGQRTWRCIGKQYFNDLVGRSFFFCDPVERKKKYRMHDFFREMSKLVSTDIRLQIEAEKLADYPPFRNTHHLVCRCNDVLSVELMNKFPNFEKLRSFVLRCVDGASIDEGIDYLLKKFRMVRLLDLSHGNVRVLPASISILKQLRYLDVSDNLITRLPNEMAMLSLLQTLKLNRCKVLESLPDCLSHLQNLRNFQFDECEKVQVMPLRFGLLTNLEILPTFIVGLGEGYKIDELKNMASLEGSLCISGLENIQEDIQDENIQEDIQEGIGEARLNEKPWLERLELKWDWLVPHPTQILNEIQFHNNLKNLVITGYGGSSFPDNWLIDSTLERIHLKKCVMCTMLPSLGNLRSLKSLCIDSMLSLVVVNTAFFLGFPSLKSLEFRGMSKLTRLPDLPANSLSSLQVIKFENCRILSRLPPLNVLGSLIELMIINCSELMALPQLPPSLRKLDIRGSKIINDRCEEDGADWDMISEIPDLIVVR